MCCIQVTLGVTFGASIEQFHGESLTNWANQSTVLSKWRGTRVLLRVYKSRARFVRTLRMGRTDLPGDEKWLRKRNQLREATMSDQKEGMEG